MPVFVSDNKLLPGFPLASNTTGTNTRNNNAQHVTVTKNELWPGFHFLALQLCRFQPNQIHTGHRCLGITANLTGAARVSLQEGWRHWRTARAESYEECSEQMMRPAAMQQRGKDWTWSPSDLLAKDKQPVDNLCNCSSLTLWHIPVSVMTS